MVANEVENPRIRGFFGAADKAIASKTQEISIVTSVLGGGLGTGQTANVPQKSPLDALIQGCYHKSYTVGNDLTETSTANDIRGIIYQPDDGAGKGVTILYQLDDIIQKGINMRGTMSFSFTTGEFSSVTFDYQGPYSAPVPGGAPTAGNAPSYQESQLISGATTLAVPGLPAEFSNCVRGFSFNQGATISLKDCATREGANPLEFLLTARESTGEIIIDYVPEILQRLYAVAGTTKTISAPLLNTPKVIKVEGGTDLKVPNAFLTLGTTPGNLFAFGADSINLGAPSLGDTDGVATATIPLTFKPKVKEGDYRFGFFGKLT